jgi:HAD superfamily hydrolase (TIGR01490 family)
VPGAAFFDLDRTLVSRSSSLALAPEFRRRGLIRRRDLAKATAAQLVFVRFGAGQSRVGQTAESAMAILRGLPVGVMHEIVGASLQTALKQHVYRDALDAVAEHEGRGEPSFIVSAALQEIVDALADELGLAGGVGSTAEVEDGVYTGRLLRRLYGQEKADALGELAAAEEIDLAASTAYSDSASDLPFLEVVGTPVVVNPDRALRAIATERGWPIRRFRTKAFPETVPGS